MANCTWRTAPGGLHLADCTWRTAPGEMHLRTGPRRLGDTDLEISGEVDWKPTHLDTNHSDLPYDSVLPLPARQHEDDDLYFIGDLEVASLKLTDPSQGSSVSS
ncbi:hypothetical protein DTO271G3_8384 [Paecilomyces variotii]|nr:hypothetical protein DTO271G3_8384 [Paecilomyces variotii]